MSIKIYNGFKTKENLSLRELEEKVTQLKKSIQKEADKLINELVVDQAFMMYDNYRFFPEAFAKKYLKLTEREFDFEAEFKMNSFVFDIIAGVYKNVKAASFEETRKHSFKYYIEAYLRIIPINEKILILWYGETKELSSIFGSQNWIEEYHYQNQTDIPDDITEDAWNKRRLDWEEAIPNYRVYERGFSVELVNMESFSFATSDIVRGISLPSKEERAYFLATHNFVPDDFDGNNYDVLYSEAGRQFFLQKAKELEPKLDDDLTDYLSRFQ